MTGGGPKYQFDQRPGALEATRGCESAAVVAVGHQGPDGWRVAMLHRGQVVAELSPEAAMLLSIEIAHAAGAVTMAGFAGDDAPDDDGGAA
ncbi:hypothetical protein [Novosphingobium colocasiae]|uniref:hypothetical protein n=1 Tax=Novosphingobium colocasiae TaxID=1256513 RepID=UPI0035AEC161